MKTDSKNGRSLARKKRETTPSPALAQPKPEPKPKRLTLCAEWRGDNGIKQSLLHDEWGFHYIRECGLNRVTGMRSANPTSLDR